MRRYLWARWKIAAAADPPSSSCPGRVVVARRSREAALQQAPGGTWSTAWPRMPSVHLIRRVYCFRIFCASHLARQIPFKSSTNRNKKWTPKSRTETNLVLNPFTWRCLLGIRMILSLKQMNWFETGLLFVTGLFTLLQKRQSPDLATDSIRYTIMNGNCVDFFFVCLKKKKVIVLKVKVWMIRVNVIYIYCIFCLQPD